MNSSTSAMSFGMFCTRNSSGEASLRLRSWRRRRAASAVPWIRWTSVAYSSSVSASEYLRVSAAVFAVPLAAGLEQVDCGEAPKRRIPRCGRRRGEERLEGGLGARLIRPDVERLEEELEVLAMSRVVLAEERLRPLLGSGRRRRRGSGPRATRRPRGRSRSSCMNSSSTMSLSPRYSHRRSAHAPSILCPKSSARPVCAIVWPR